METLQFVKSELKKQLDEYAAKYQSTVKELFFGDNIEIIWKKPYLEFCFGAGYVVYSDSNNTQEPIASIIFTCAIKTPKGYISSKKIGVSVKDNNNVTIEEAAELLKFNTDAIKNNFDPFWKENQARHRNSAAWNFIASNYLQDDCR